MHMALILADMPDLWHRILTEHVSDSHGRCASCRDRSGAAAPWPCVARQIADEARAIYEGRYRVFGWPCRSNGGRLFGSPTIMAGRNAAYTSVLIPSVAGEKIDGER